MFLAKTKSPAPHFDKDFIKPLPVPTQKEVETWLLDRRKQALVSIYLSNSNESSLQITSSAS